MLSIGGDCKFYLDELKEFNIQKVNTRYSIDGTTQRPSVEYLINNYGEKKTEITWRKEKSIEHFLS